MAQIARNLIDPVDGFLREKRFLIADLDTKFTERFREVLEQGAVRVVRTAYQAPNRNAIAERWVRSVKSECLERLVLFGEGMLLRALRDYVAHFNSERPHQGLGNGLVAGDPAPSAPVEGDVVEAERLGGLLRHYQRVA